MQYNKGPYIVNTVPKANANGHPVDQGIEVVFDKDIDKTTISGNVLLIDGAGNAIECRYQYTNKVLTIVPRENLSQGKSYTVIVHGDNNPNDATAPKGITSVTGTSMLGDYRFSFTTITAKLQAERLFGLTPNGIVLNEIPTLKGESTTETINPTKVVHIEISNSNTFEDGLLVWSGECSIEDFEKGFKPNLNLFDGTYYWRARPCSDTVALNYGMWSEPAQFAIETHTEATVVTSDHIDVDVAFPEHWDMLGPSIIEVYPQNKRSHVKTNLKTMSIVFDQIVSEQVLEDCYLTLIGEPVDDDINNETHGQVDIKTSVIYDHDAQTTTIVILLPELGGETI